MASSKFDVRTAVTHAILFSETLGSAVIEVIESNGSVTLKGRVTSEQDRILAEELTSGQPGVVEVVNNLIVLK